VGKSLTEVAGFGMHSLTAFGDDDKQVLVAVRKNKEQVEIEGLSDGTRDQLYLSLRLAAIEDHVARVAPCPVILDDILIKQRRHARRCGPQNLQ
jgi:uncharacterized protein YhaN